MQGQWLILFSCVNDRGLPSDLDGFYWGGVWPLSALPAQPPPNQAVAALAFTHHTHHIVALRELVDE